MSALLCTASTPTERREFLMQNIDQNTRVSGYLRCSATGELVADFKVTNTGRHAISIREETLPWSGRNTVTLALADVETNTVILPEFAFSDPISKTVSVAPGESLEGTVSISEELPALQRLQRERDVVLFWAFRVRTADANTRILAGSIVVPQDERCP
jgi:hypothetical protein